MKTTTRDRIAAFDFLCDCLADIATGDPRETACPNVGWATFVALAHEYRVSCAVASAIERNLLRCRLPDNVKSYFKGLAAHWRKRNARVCDEAVEVGRILNEIDVTPLFMKGGAHILTELYQDRGMRDTADLDILVPEERLGDCVSGLKDHGIEMLTTYRHPRSHHYQPLGRPDLPVPIELHYQVLAYPNCDFLSPKDMRASAIHVERHSASVMVPSPTYAVLHNIAHAQLNDRDCLYGRLDLRGLLDLALLSNVHSGRIDWDVVKSRFYRAGHRYSLQYHVHWARRLGAKVPSLCSAPVLSSLLHRRAVHHVGRPVALSASVRLLRPLVLLRRELSDTKLRRRLARNMASGEWWRRHLRMLTDA